ncbi:MAG: F0F1 ATP synthase subunit A [Alphaproteobacteria bacterium]|jgi:F-type H+-transporting ATPase subunit a|nr:F0F1 ATP synthase subunit A [Alphaproteobacteria bacterium]
MDISPDTIVFYAKNFEIMGRTIPVNINMTIVGTWIIMLFIAISLKLLTKNLKGDIKIPRLQNVVEVVVEGTKSQIAQISRREPSQFLPLIGSLFLFIFISNLSSILPLYFYSPISQTWEGYQPPTGSFSTTLAFSLLILFSVFYYGIRHEGVKKYFLSYLYPKPFMLPFNILSNISNTASLAIRLYGNIMSGTVIIAILLALSPLVFPIVMQLYGILTGSIQAYIFSVLGLVYISSAMGDLTEEDYRESEKYMTK